MPFPLLSGKRGETGSMWKVLICFENTHCCMFWQRPSGAYLVVLVTRTGWCCIEMVTNYIFHTVPCSAEKSYKLCPWCGAQNEQEQFLKSPKPGSDVKKLTERHRLCTSGSSEARHLHELGNPGGSV